MKIIATLLFSLFFSSNVFASHILGGEIIVRYKDETPNLDDYELTLKLLRDRSGIFMRTSHDVSAYRKVRNETDTKVGCWSLACSNKTGGLCSNSTGLSPKFHIDNPSCASIVMGSSSSGGFNFGEYIYENTNVILDSNTYSDKVSPHGVYFV